MADSFFFYDLETSGFSPRQARIMQFAGQRTDMNLKPIGEPVNVLIKITPDVVPSPDAILLTGITPQQTLSEGLSEAEFLKFFYEEVVKPGTIFTGFNSVRFDDEFMRFIHYRNFYDAYEWQWKDGCSRWDILDLVRMTRALRPEGIEWPFAPDGKPANRLELLTAVNKLTHEAAHDALSDVHATIAVAQLIKNKQPDLFRYVLDMRDKKKVAALVEANQPFVYTTGRYPGTTWHTSVAVSLTKHPQNDSRLVYDLRHDPTPFINMNVNELIEAWKFTKDPDILRLPVKTLKYNRCPALAPLGVIKDVKVQERIQLDLDTVSKHAKILQKNQQEFAKKVLEALQKMDESRGEQAALIDNQLTVDERLYDGFIGPADKTAMGVVRAATPDDLTSLEANLKDDRLKSMLPLYKARNYPSSLTSEEREKWDEFCKQQVFAGGNESRLAKYFARLQELASDASVSGEKQYLLEELQLYGQSIVPADATD